jgi:LAO/AO transport system kinase
MDLLKAFFSGDVRACARIITVVENRGDNWLTYVKKIYPRSGKALIIGITGAPGTGKSTLCDKLIRHYRASGKTVGVVAVDPTSPFSGGAIMGDRIRMNEYFQDPGVFIRSMATRGHFGGLSPASKDIVSILDAFGKDIILVETVGVGQDEIDIFRTAHTSIVVIVPGMGDDIQNIKAGIMEIADIFVLNKADREEVEKTELELLNMLKYNYPEKKWIPPIYRTVAVHDSGIEKLIEGIEKHNAFLKSENLLSARMRERAKQNFLDTLKDEIALSVVEKLKRTGDFQRYITRIARKETDMYSVIEGIKKDLNL